MDAEIVSLFARPSCLKPPDFPLANPMSLIGSFVDGNPNICGFLEQESFCYSLDIKNQYWNIHNYTIIEQRSHAAGVQLENGSWIIFGGQKFSEGVPVLLNTSEILIETQFYFGPQLPLSLSGHCVVKVDDDQIFTAGGYGQPFLKDTFYLQIQNNTWQSITPMQQGRYGHVCGKVLSSFNDIQIVAAGGLRVDKAELYLYQKQYWINGPDMMRKNFFKAASVQGPTNFIIIGGLELEPCATSNCQLEEIYIFERNIAWKFSQQKLKKGRGNHIAIKLPPEIECTSKYLKRLLIFPMFELIYYYYGKM